MCSGPLLDQPASACKDGNVSLLIFSRSEPEPFVSLSFVKNDSYEKGNDLVVVHVYMKEIHKETSKVLFREQDFTLLFQTRCMPWDGAGLLQSFRLQPSYSLTFHSLPISLQRRKLPSPPSWLRAPHGVPVAGEAQVCLPSFLPTQGQGRQGCRVKQEPFPAGSAHFCSRGSLTLCCPNAPRLGCLGSVWWLAGLEMPVPCPQFPQPILEALGTEPDQPVCTLGRMSSGRAHVEPSRMDLPGSVCSV